MQNLLILGSPKASPTIRNFALKNQKSYSTHLLNSPSSFFPFNIDFLPIIEIWLGRIVGWTNRRFLAGGTNRRFLAGGTNRRLDESTGRR